MADIKESSEQVFNIPESLLAKLSKKKIYFGHMSVGYNIIDGMNDITKDNSAIKLNILETNNVDDFNSPIFAHSKNGQNMNPKSKIDAFVNLMENGLGSRVDVSFFKLCYVDILGDTDVEKVFNYYKSAMENLKKKFPKTTFIHFTVPLMAERRSVPMKTKIKDLIKRLIGRMTSKEKIINENIKRFKYNELFRKEFDKKEIFDFALIESTYPDGKREVSNEGGESHFALVPEFTYDGGHLNERGRRFVARHLLEYLSKLTAQ